MCNITKGGRSLSSVCSARQIFKCEFVFVIMLKPLLRLTFCQTLILSQDVLKIQTNAQQISTKKKKKKKLESAT